MKKLVCPFVTFFLPFLLFADGLNPAFNNGKGIVKHKFNHLVDGANFTSVEVFQQNQLNIYRAAKTTLNQQTVLFIQCYNSQMLADSSFGINGELYLPFPKNFMFSKVCIGSNRSVLVAGSDSAVTLRDIYLARYFSTGNIDTGFGNNGVLKKPLTYLNDFVQDALIQSDGKILLISNDILGENFKVLRFNVDGTSDASFNGNGEKSIDLGSADLAQKILVAPDNKILVAGKAFLNNKSKIGLVKLLSNGQLDSSFAVNGKSIESIGTDEDILMDFQLLASGNLMALLQTNIVSSTNAVVQWNANGSRADLFGLNGVLNIEWHSDKGFTTDTSGNFYIHNTFFIRKYNPSGSLDSVFPNQGIQYHYTNNYATITNLLVNNNRLVVMGNLKNLLYYNNYLLSGILDTNAYQNGVYVRFIGNSSVFNSKLTLLASGSNSQGVLVCLLNSSTNPLQLFLVKFLTDGSRDSSFGENGLCYFNITKFRDNAFSVKFINDNKILVAFALNDSICYLNCFQANGNIDSSFAQNGKLKMAIKSPENIKLIIDNESRIVVGANTLLRYFANGVRDSSLFLKINGFRTLMVLKSGSLLIGGTFGIMRINSNGVFDFTFANNGYFKDSILDPTNRFNKFTCTDLSYDYRKMMILASGTFLRTIPTIGFTFGSYLIYEDGKTSTFLFKNGASVNSIATHLSLPKNGFLVAATNRIDSYSLFEPGILQFKNWNINSSFNTTGKIDQNEGVFANPSSSNSIKACQFGSLFNNKVLLLRATDSAIFISEISVAPDTNFPYQQMKIYASKNNIGVNEEIYLTLKNSKFPHQKNWKLPIGSFEFTRGSKAQSDTCYLKFTQLGNYDIGLDYILSDTTINISETNFIYVMSVGLNTVDKSSLKIYPNPCMGELKIEFGDLKVYNYQLLDLNGKIIYTKNQPTSLVEKLSLPDNPGVYILQLFTKDGQVLNYKVLRD